MKIFSVLFTLICLNAQNDQTFRISLLNDFRSIKSERFYLAWTIPVSTEYQSMYYKKGTTIQFSNHSTSDISSFSDFDLDLSQLNPSGMQVMLISFSDSPAEIDLTAAFHQKILGLPEKRELYWAGDQTTVNSYQFLLSLLDEIDDEFVLYELLINHRMDSDNFALFKEKYLKSNDPKRRKKLLYWIGRTETQEALKFLIAEFNTVNTDELRKEILYAVNRSKQEEGYQFISSIALSNDYSNPLRKEAIYYARKSNSANLPSVYKQFLNQIDQDELLKEVIYAIYKSDIKESKLLFKSIIDDSKFNRKLKKEAIYYLYKMSDFTELKAAFASVSDDVLRKEILYHINKIGSDESTSELIRIMNDQSVSFTLRKESMYYLSKRESDLSAQAIQNVATHSENEYNLRKEAVYYLYKQRRFQELKQLYILSDNQQLRKELVYYFYKLDSDDSIDFMAKLIKLPDTSVSVKKEILHYLGKSGHSKAKLVLDEIVN
ncbi:MAG: hypothetical protein KDD94_12605 [Calditrichaeota bacterium]|nr:hypothetical protein [Calditrichota bacterium]